MNKQERDKAIADLCVGSVDKWPQMLVTGKSVTPEQAKDIILRTDRFLTDASEYSGGNNHEFNEWYRTTAGLDRLAVVQDHPNGGTYQEIRWNKMAALRDAIGFIDTDYVRNDWTSCAFIFGPHGWCHPDGTIAFSDNVGKWPAETNIADDWEKIAVAFPFLDLYVTLMSGESCDDDKTPVITFRVVNGTVTPMAPDLSVHEGTSVRDFDSVSGFSNPYREQGLPNSWVKEYADIIRNKLEEIV